MDIKIEYTGLRPGEKLYEEKLMAEEGLKRTANRMIHIGCPIPFDVDAFLVNLNRLMQTAYANRQDIRQLVAEMVETYHPAEAAERAERVELAEPGGSAEPAVLEKRGKQILAAVG